MSLGFTHRTMFFLVHTQPSELCMTGKHHIKEFRSMNKEKKSMEGERQDENIQIFLICQFKANKQMLYMSKA